jgi:DNA-binding NarL/FixJ family response regulator
MSVQAVKLLLVEDSSVLAARIEEVVREIPEIELVAVADSEAGALNELRRRRVHIVILDLHLREGTGFGILRSIGDFRDKPHVLVLTNHDSSTYENDAIALGASAFLDKAKDFENLPDILQRLIGRLASPETVNQRR